MELHLSQSGHFHAMPPVRTVREQPTDYLMVYVTAGRMRVGLGRQTYHAGPGDLVLMPPGVPQDYASLDEPWAWLWVHFDGPAARDLHRSLTKRHGPVAPMGLDPLIRERLSELVLLDTRPHRRASDPRPPALAQRDDQRTDALLVGVMGLIRHRIQSQGDSAPPRHVLDETALRRYLQDHLSQQVTLPQLAQAFSLSTAHFSRLFHKAFGTSPMRYLTRMRVDHAAQLLSRTDLKLAAIGRHVGYDDPYHFARVFKQTTGIPPATYRRRLKEV